MVIHININQNLLLARKARFCAFMLFFIIIGCASNTASVSKSTAAAASASPDIRVCLSAKPHNATLSFNGNYLVEMEEAVYRFDASIGELEVQFRGGNLILKNDKRFFELSPPQTLIFQSKDANNTVTWNKIIYPGNLTLHFDTDGRMLVINTLSLETYLHGVIANEIPTNQSEYQEAVVAQAIASRSYALYRLDNPLDARYDIRADKPGQVYKGLEKTSPLSDKAIAKTEGMILSRLNQPANVQFHSTSGGVLELSTTSDSASASNRNYTPDSVDGEDNDKVSPYYRWVENRSIETILHNLERLFKLNSATIERWMDDGFTIDVSIISRKPSGRVQTAIVSVNGREFILDTPEKIKAAFADETGKPLLSTLFFIKSPEENTEHLYILGAGEGHGMGMSQWGAIGLALKGYDHRYILGFYYPDLTITKYY